MADQPVSNELMLGVVGTLGTAAGVIGGKLVDRFRKRDEMDSSQLAGMTRKLWKQNEELTAKVDQCQEHHRDCEVRAGKLEVEVTSLRTEFDDLKRRVERADILE